MKKTLIFALIILALLLAACGDGGLVGRSQQTAATQAPTEVPAEATEAPTEAPTQAPTEEVVPFATTTPTAIVIVVTSTPTVSASPTPGAVTYTCPTLQDLRNATGLDWTRIGGPSTNELCTYNYNTADYSYEPMPLLQGWMTTTAQEDGLVHIKKGDATTVMSKATTIRLLSANPTLTSERQTDLTKQYAPSAGYSADIVVCDDCGSGYVSNVTPVATMTAPVVPGFTCSAITGGYVCSASPAADFVVPSGWKAYAGIPASWYPSGSALGLQSQVSLYPE